MFVKVQIVQIEFMFVNAGPTSVISRWKGQVLLIELEFSATKQGSSQVGK